MSSKLEKPIYTLLQNEPFFAHFLLGCRFVFDHPQVKTAGVSVQRGDIVFYIDTDYFFTQPLTAQTAILKHEVFHLLLEHCGVRNGGSDKNKTATNIAMDCAINQHIADLPEGCVTVKSLSDAVKKPLLPFESWEYYYEQMKDLIDQAEKMAGKLVDDHTMMQEGEGEGELGKEQRRMAVKDAAGKAVNAAAGNVPEALMSVLGNLNKVAKIPWKQQLRNFVSSARSAKNKPTRMKPNRRFGLDQPGRKKIRELVLAVCVDESGSMSDDMVAECYQEIFSISKNTKKTYLIHADCTVAKVDVIKDGKVKGDVLKTRHAAGGTAYQPAITKAMELGCDAIIYLGDMDASDVPKNPGVPFIWVVVGGQSPPADFGRVLRL